MHLYVEVWGSVEAMTNLQHNFLRAFYRFLLNCNNDVRYITLYSFAKNIFYLDIFGNRNRTVARLFYARDYRAYRARKAQVQDWLLRLREHVELSGVDNVEARILRGYTERLARDLGVNLPVPAAGN